MTAAPRIINPTVTTMNYIELAAALRLMADRKSE